MPGDVVAKGDKRGLCRDATTVVTLKVRALF